MNERELSGVIAHELSHVQNREILITAIAATLAGADRGIDDANADGKSGRSTV